MTPNISKFGQYFKFRVFSTSNFYTKNHEWIKLTQGEEIDSEKQSVRALMGITDYSQKALGDIVFIEMPKIDTKYNLERKKHYCYHEIIMIGFESFRSSSSG